MTNNENDKRLHNRKQLLKKTFEQKRTKNNRIDIYVIEQINEKRYLINDIDVRFERKKVRCKKIDREIFNEKRQKLKKKNDEQKVNEKLLVDEFSTQQNVIKLIKTTYFNDIILQKFIKVKKLKRRRVFVNITRTKMKLKFEKCEIRNEFF